MNANDPPAEVSVPNDPTKTRSIESDPGSGTPLHVGDVRCRPVAPPAIPDHELLRVIGHGAYGEVWLARNIMGAYRAVKIVYRDSFDNDRPYQREFSGIRSFEPISRGHESQVDILHVGRNDTERWFYYVMELADDGSESREQKAESRNWEAYAPKTVRSELKRRGRFPHAESLEICLALTTAAEHLHKHGLIHRDIKPANVIFVNGLPKLADIGLVTETGGTISFVGTEGYLPPEGPGSVQADIFSLGKTLYEVATGKDRLEFPELPTLTDSPAEEAGLFELNEVLLKACHPDVQQRYQTAAEMHADLVLLQAGKSIRRSRALEQRLAVLTKIAAGVLLVASLALAAYLYQQFQTREARRLAIENRELAVKETKERERAEGLLNTLQLKEAEHFFESDDANKGVAYLAYLLRQNPSNPIVGSRLMSALTDRSFALPVWTFKSGDDLQGADFNPNSRQFVTWGGTGTNGVAHIRDVATGQVAGKPMHHSAAVWRARYSPDGRLIATVAANGDARIWDAATGEPRSETLKPPQRFSRERPFAFSPNGELLVIAAGNEARIWKVAPGEFLDPKFNHGKIISDVEFGPDGQCLATSGEDQSKLWNSVSGTLQHTLAPGGDGPRRTRFSPDGRRLLTIGGFHAGLWDVDSGERLLLLDSDAVVTSARFSPDGARLVTTDANRAVRMFDAQSGQHVFPPLMHGGRVLDAQFDAFGERLLTWESRRARVWDARTGRPLTEWLLHGADIRTAQFSPDGDSVLTAANTTATLWDVRPGRAANIVLQNATLLPSARFSPDGARVVTASGGWVYSWWRDEDPWEVAVWDAQTGELAAPRIALPGVAQYAEFSPDGRKVLTAYNNGEARVRDAQNGEARVWDAQSSAAISAVMKHIGRIRSARFSPDGRRVVTLSVDNTARIWDAETGLPTTSPLELPGSAYSAEFSPDGLSVLTASSGGARVFDAQTGQPRGTESYGKDVRTACFSPDGQLIATGSGDGAARVWNVRTGKPVGESLNHKAAILSVRFSPDGRYVVTASEDQTARVWDVLSGKPVAEPLAHKGVVLSAEFSPDSRRVVTASVDYTARVWDMRTGRPLTEPFRENHWVSQAQFSPDGTRIVLASSAYLARICQLPPLRGPSPEWLPGLAEAVAGEKWNDQEELVSPEQYLACRAEFLKRTETNDQSRWAKWLLADRSTRPASYASPAWFIKHPDSQALSPGAEAVFHVQAESDAPLTYQWQFNGVDIPGATNATFAIKSATRGDAGAYRAKIRNAIHPGLVLTSHPAWLIMQTGGFGYGNLRREVFRNISGGSLRSLTNHIRFPDSPDTVDFVSQFEIPANVAENYGVRLSGYLVPPKTGEYRFYLCADGEGALFLSTSRSPEHKRQIAHEPRWNSQRQWTSIEARPNRENISESIQLEAGRHYYVEALMKEGTSSDNLAVAWQMPGEPPPENLSPPIPGAYLAIPTEWVKPLPAPLASGATATDAP